jgi:hypothetical protein
MGRRTENSDADDQPVDPKGKTKKGSKVQGPGVGHVSPEKRCVLAGEDDDPQEAQFGAQKDRAGEVDERA